MYFVKCLRRFLPASALLLTFLSAGARDAVKLTRIEYISQYKDDAIREMYRSGVPASITLAQACLESSDGNSPLAKEANNHFGIKCSNWDGPGYYQDDDKPNECFRKYNSVLESFDDHSKFLRTRPRYAFLFELDKTDYKGWAHGLKKAGYATDPTYASRLIKIIEDFNLHTYDLAENPDNRAVASTSNTLPADTRPILTQPESRPREQRVLVPSVEPVDAFSNRRIERNNGVEFIRARKGDTFESLSRELGYGYWQLPKYNELPGNTPLYEGQIIYIQPKKRDAETRFYIVKPGDTVHSVAQELGMKTRFLCRYNELEESASLTPGTRLQVSE
jgi:hypothetical protein